MSFSIDEFVSTVGEKGIQDPTKYKVVVTGPNGALSQDGLSYCTGFEASGITFDTTENWYHGPVRNVPYLEKYDQGVSLTFYNDYDMSEYRYFYKWMAFIGGNEFYIKYYDEIIGEITLTSYDREGKPRVTVRCIEAYPTSISEMSFAYNKRSEIPTFSVDFAVHHIEIS